MALVHWQPFQELDTLQQRMNRLFDELAIAPDGNREGAGITFAPAVEMKETDDEIHLRLEVPGMEPKDLDVRVTAESVGEREMAADNKSLGTFHLDGIPPAPRGTPQIEVTFDIDANGILSVSAKDKATGKEQSITITGASTLDEKEVDRMVKDAQAHAEADRKRREQIDTKNMADSLAYQAEKQLQDLGDKIPAADKSRVEDLVKQLRDAINSDTRTKGQGEQGLP